MKPKLDTRIVYGRTYNLGNKGFKKIEVEINGNIEDVEKYTEIENLIKDITIQIGKTIEKIKDNLKEEEVE